LSAAERERTYPPSIARLLCAAVVVLSREFVRKRFTMRELRIFLERKARDPTFVIIPVFYELTVEQCSNLEQLYVCKPWPTSPGVPKVADKDVLKGWAEDVRKLLDVTGAKIEEVRAWPAGFLLSVGGTRSINGWLVGVNSVLFGIRPPTSLCWLQLHTCRL
jgi:hypothetical protein